MKTWLAPAAIVVAALAVTVGAGAQSPPKPQWVVALNEEAESVDPASSVLFASDVYHVHMFDSLVGLEGDELKPVPLLAERWEIVSPTTWRFHLRRGVKFHDGETFDAQDVKYSFETYLDPKNRRASFAKGISSARRGSRSWSSRAAARWISKSAGASTRNSTARRTTRRCGSSSTRRTSSGPRARTCRGRPTT